MSQNRQIVGKRYIYQNYMTNYIVVCKLKEALAAYFYIVF